MLVACDKKFAVCTRVMYHVIKYVTYVENRLLLYLPCVCHQINGAKETDHNQQPRFILSFSTTGLPTILQIKFNLRIYAPLDTKIGHYRRCYSQQISWLVRMTQTQRDVINEHKYGRN